MKSSIELPIVGPEMLTWTNHEGINTPRSGKRHYNHQRAVNSFNTFMNPQWKQEDIEKIIISDYLELEESLHYNVSSSPSSSVEDVGSEESMDYVHVSNYIYTYIYIYIYIY